MAPGSETQTENAHRNGTACDPPQDKTLGYDASPSETTPLLPPASTSVSGWSGSPGDDQGTSGCPATAACCQPDPAIPSAGPGRRHWGLLLALLAALSSSLVSVVVQRLESVDPACLSVFRFLAIVPAAGLAALRRGCDVFPRGHRVCLLLRAVFGAAALICKFYALRRLLLADASVLLLSAPVFVSVWACLLLGEPCGALHVLTLLTTVAGALLIVRPGWMRLGAGAGAGGGGGWRDDVAVSAIGAALAVSSALLLSMAYVTLRRLQNVHWSATVLVFGVVGAAMSYALWLATGAANSPSGTYDWLMVLALGVLTLIMQFAFTVACQLEEAGPVAVARTSEIVFAVMWQVVCFQHVPGPYSVAGMVLVMLSVLALALHKCISQRRDTGSVA